MPQVVANPIASAPSLTRRLASTGAVRRAVRHLNRKRSIQKFRYERFFKNNDAPAFGSWIDSTPFAVVRCTPVWLLYGRHIVVNL
jgi:hypothetical protein